MTRSVEQGLREAWDNLVRVLGGGFIAFCLYLALISFGPGIEGRFFPVITSYKLDDVRTLAGGGFSFRPTFVKTRDCTYFGVTWFAQDAAGNLTRIQLGRNDASPPETGPVGSRIGNRVDLFPPEGTVSIFALNHHECGALWRTRTLVGPFPLVDGRPHQRDRVLWPSKPIHRAACYCEAPAATVVLTGQEVDKCGVNFPRFNHLRSDIHNRVVRGRAFTIRSRKSPMNAFHQTRFGACGAYNCESHFADLRLLT